MPYILGLCLCIHGYFSVSVVSVSVSAQNPKRIEFVTPPVFPTNCICVRMYLWHKCRTLYIVAMMCKPHEGPVYRSYELIGLAMNEQFDILFDKLENYLQKNHTLSDSNVFHREVVSYHLCMSILMLKLDLKIMCGILKCKAAFLLLSVINQLTVIVTEARIVNHSFI